MTSSELLPLEIFDLYPQLERGAPISTATDGLINLTLIQGCWVIQRLHPIFTPEVNLDIARLVPLLRRGGLVVPTLLPSQKGLLWHVDRTGATWRVMERLPGKSHGKINNTAQISELAKALACFHQSLLGINYKFKFSRPGAHDTTAHFAALKQALKAYPKAKLAAEVGFLAQEISKLWATWGDIPKLPQRIGHGDPKSSNFLFENDRVSGVIDLDTMGYTSIDIELGDALRSWANLADENANADLSLDFAQVALSSYLKHSQSWLSPEERAALPLSLERIGLELSSRFARDALEDRYFGWNPDIAPSRIEHNLLRARNQLQLAKQARELRAQLTALCSH